VRQLRAEAVESDELDELRRNRLPLGLALPLNLETDRDVGEDRAPREQRRVLEDQRAVRARPRYDVAGDGDRARRGLRDPVDEVQQAALAAAAGPDDRNELALGDRQRKVRDRNERFTAGRGGILEVHVIDDDVRGSLI